MRQIHFQLVKEEDFETVLMLFKEAAERIARLNIDHWQYWKKPPKDKIDWVHQGIHKREFYFIRDSLKNRIGMLRIMNEDILYWGKQSEEAKYVHSLVIEDGFKGKGLGQLVLEYVETLGKKAGCKYLRLDADSSNLKLCKYYLNLGFTQAGSVELENGTYNLFQKEIP